MIFPSIFVLINGKITETIKSVQLKNKYITHENLTLDVVL